MHKVLQRQIRHALGLAEESALPSLLDAAVAAAEHPGLAPEVAGLLRNLGTLLARVDATYEQAGRDLDLRTRSLEISSAELTAANNQLRTDLEVRNRAVQSLRATVAELVGVGGGGDIGPADGLESLSRIIARLVREREKQRVHLDNIRFALDQHAIVSITDTSGMITYANDKFCEISGYTRDELVGANHRIVKSGRHPPAFFAGLWQTITNGRVWHGEVCNRTRDGHEYWVAATIVPFLDESGQPYEYIAIRTDISARKRAEEALILARDAAEAANRAKSEFLATMSHEIRTPMNGIIGMTALALNTALDAEQREYLQIVNSSAEGLLTIINEILDFSKMEAGKLQIERVNFDLRQEIEETLEPLGVRATQKGLTLAADYAADVPQYVTGDPLRLRQVLINLVGNAVKFTGHGGITVSCRVESRAPEAVTLTIAVRDTGIGIAPDKLESIFEAFSQADSSTTRPYGGTGLGLTISNRLVELMGGRVKVESVVGSGSTFSFSLVLGLASAPARVDALPAAAATMPPPSVFDYGQALAVMDPDVLAAIIPTFFDYCPGELATLEQALGAGAAEAAVFSAHAMKGTLAAFGAEPARRRAAEIEVLSRAGQADEALQLLPALRAEIEALAAALRARQPAAP